jgi:hypothetical protein
MFNTPLFQASKRSFAEAARNSVEQLDFAADEVVAACTFDYFYLINTNNLEFSLIFLSYFYFVTP